MINIADYFATLAACVPLVLIITGWINTQILKNSPTWAHRITSWVVAIGVSFIGAWKDLGIFADLTILWTAIYGLALGLVANGIFDINIVQELLKLLGARKKTA